MVVLSIPVFRHQQLSLRSWAGDGAGVSNSETLCLNLADAPLGRGLFHDLDSRAHVLLHGSRAPFNHFTELEMEP